MNSSDSSSPSFLPSRSATGAWSIGCDLTSVERISSILASQGKRFCERVLTEIELKEFQRRTEKSETFGARYLATRFAAKEALSKALGTGIGQNFGFHDVSVVNEPNGKPVFLPSAKLEAMLHSMGAQALVSISDEGSLAMCTVLLSPIEKEQR